MRKVSCYCNAIDRISHEYPTEALRVEEIGERLRLKLHIIYNDDHPTRKTVGLNGHTSSEVPIRKGINLPMREAVITPQLGGTRQGNPSKHMAPVQR